MIARRNWACALAIIASLAWTGRQSAAQPPVENGAGGPVRQEKASPRHVRSKAKLDDGSIRVRLLMVETVQKDLGLTADQIGKLRDCVKIAGEEYRENVAKLREILPPSRQFAPGEYEARLREFRALAEDLRSKQKAFRTKILAMLTPSQSERLKQIQLQVAIPAALARPEIIKALNISEEQRGKICACAIAWMRNGLQRCPISMTSTPRTAARK